MTLVRAQHLKALLKKNMIIWKRSIIVSLVEIVFPILLMIAIIVVRGMVLINDIQPYSFVSKVQLKAGYIPEDVKYMMYPLNTAGPTPTWNRQYDRGNFTFFNQQPLAYYQFYPRGCLSYERTRNKIAIAPKNAITMQLEQQIRQWALQMNASYGFMYKIEPKFYDSEEEILDIIKRDDYEKVDDGEGICAAITYSLEDDGKTHHVKLHFDDTDQKLKNLAPQKDYPFDQFNREPDFDGYKKYTEQGYTFFHNWMANAVLRTETGQKNASIANLIMPMRTNEVKIDTFVLVSTYLLPLCMVLMYIVPINRTISRIVNEKENKARESMRIMGLSDTSYWLSWLIYYLTVSTIIALVSSMIISVNVFPNSNKFLLFLYFWLYGLSLFGFIVFAQSFFSKARIASTVSTLIYFFLTFADYAVQDNYMNEKIRIACSLLPSIAMRRAEYNIAIFEEGGVGLQYDNLSLVHFNYKVSTAFWMFVLSFIIGTMVGIYLTNVINLGSGYNLPWYYPFKKSYWFPQRANSRVRPQYYPSQVADLEDKKPGEEDYDANFELDGNPKMPPENYETVMRPDLKTQELDKKILKISRLQKTFDNGFKGVNQLSVKMYNGQIFALLGHNGAGKTTTIQMLMGLLDPTSGHAEILGRDLFGEMNEVRKFLGVCHQHDILFEHLTPREHLEIFCDFKGVSGPHLKAEIDQMLIDVDLDSYKTTMAKNLSGGNRRKLSVAIALIGGSKFVLLDEPTAGMDLTARRRLWNMLKDYKHNRIIILTTHYMDEADILGDRIGIMSGGGLICMGSSLFLKNRFGVGYNLTMVKTNKEPNTKIEKYLLDNLGEVKKLTEIASEISFQLPFHLCPKFKTFFDEFDKDLENLDIRSYGISVTTLEEVFLRVSMEGNEYIKGVENQDPQNEDNTRDKEKEEKLKEEEELLEEYTIAERQEQGRWNIFKIHTKALFLKRYQQYKRNYRGFITEVFVPVLLVLIGFGFSMAQYFHDSPARELSTVFMPLKQRMLVNSNVWKPSLNDIQPVTLMNNMLNASDFDVTYKTYLNQSGSFLQTPEDYTFSTFDYDVHHQQYDSELQPYRYGSYFIYEANNATKQFKFVTQINSTGQDAPAFIPHFMYDSIIRSATGKKDLKFKTTTAAFPVTKRQKGETVQTDGMFIVFVVAIGFALIPSTIVSYIVHEREKNIKHMQWISGMNMVSYWLSNYIFDVCKAYIPMVLVIALLYIFDFHYMYVWIQFLLYPLAIVPFTYVTSFIFPNELIAQTVTVFFHFVFSGICCIITFMLRLIPETKANGDTLQWAFKFSPSFCLTNTIMFSSGISQLEVQRTDLNLEYFNMNNLLGDIIIMVVHFVFWTLLLIIMEGGLVKYLETLTCCARKIKPNENLKLDEDVQEEEDRIPQYLSKAQLAHNTKNHEESKQDLNEGVISPSEQMQVIVHNFRKVYNMAWWKTQLAVERSTFGLSFGECFALLGVNGAGKTTTFKSLTNGIVPTSGTIMINGQDTRKSFGKIRKMIGYCPQYDCVFDLLTVEEHLEYYARIKGIPPEMRKVLVEKQIQEMNLHEHRTKPAGTLSGGNKRKLSVAMAIIGNPPIVLLDEPSAGMDPKARRFMWSVVEKISQKRKKSAVILTTHSMEEAEALSTKMGIMVQGGYFKCYGSSQHIKNKFGTGYEIEIKVHKIIEDEQKQLEIDYELKNGEERIELTQAVQLLNKLGSLSEILVPEIRHTGLGRDLFKEAEESQGTISTKNFMHWLYVQIQGFKLIKDLTKDFSEVELLEHYNDYYKIRVPKQGKSIGYLFGLIESNKEKYRIKEYSVSQTTLEQIFQTFANAQLEKQGIIFTAGANNNIVRVDKDAIEDSSQK